MHAADRNTKCVQHNKTHVDKSVRSRANPRPRTHTMTENGARVSEPQHEPKLKTWVPESKHHAPHKTRYADERARDSSILEAARSHENPDMMGVSGLCHKTTNNTRLKWQSPDNGRVRAHYSWVKDFHSRAGATGYHSRAEDHWGSSGHGRTETKIIDISNWLLWPLRTNATNVTQIWS